MELTAINKCYRKAFLEGTFQFPSLFLSEDEKIKFAVRFPLYVNDEESYILALSKAMMLSCYDNGVNSAGLFVATDDGEFLFVAHNNKILLYELVDNEFVEVGHNVVDTFTMRIMREYLSTYSKKDYSVEVVETLHEQGFEVETL